MLKYIPYFLHKISLFADECRNESVRKKKNTQLRHFLKLLVHDFIRQSPAKLQQISRAFLLSIYVRALCETEAGCLKQKRVNSNKK